MRNLTFALLSIFLLVATSGASAYNLDRAIAEQKALASDRPNDAAVQNDLGNLLGLRGDVAGAEAAYRKAIELDPKAASPHFNLGLLLEKRGDRGAALKQFKKTVDLEPTHAWAHYQTGVIYQDWGLKPLARRQFARALALDPRLADPSVNPHMIENPLGIQSMLDAYKKQPQDLQPPRRYAEPSRIARLMVEPAPGENPDSVTEAEAPAQGSRLATSEETSAASGAPRVLRTTDLDRSSGVNQVSGGAGGVGSKSATRPGLARTTQGREQLIERYKASHPGAVVPGGGSPGPLKPGAGGAAPPPQVPYVPPVGSTGRLDIRLLPHDATGAAG